MVWLLLMTAGVAAPPAWTRVEVTYTVTYDLPPMADQVCGMTGICDCTVTWRGDGTRAAGPASTGTRLTFRGHYRKVSGGCHEALELWAPADGAASHTLVVSADGKLLREWIAHGDPAATTRVTSAPKAAGQVWLAEMAAPIGGGRARHEESESGQAGAIPIESTHVLEVRLVGG